MITKNGPKPKVAVYKKILEKKAEEVRRSMSAQKAAQVVARLDCPSDEGDLSQQSHEEWIFLNRNTIDMKLLREIAGALRRIEQGTFGNGMDCVISERGIAQIPALKGVPDFNLETELAAAQEFQMVAPAPAQGKGAKDAASPPVISRAELAAIASGGSTTAHAGPDHDDE